MKWLTVKKVLELHEHSLARDGGDPGVRDQGLLESAIAQPRARFDGKDLYPGIVEKAAALAFSPVRNHPFVDGNKRTGYGAMMMFLGRNGCTIQAPLDEHVSTFLRLASGELDREAFLAWIREHIVREGPVRSVRRPQRPPSGSE